MAHGEKALRLSSENGEKRPVTRHPSPVTEVEASLYEVRRKIHPRAVSGWFAGWRWALVWLTQLVFYGGPWLTWNGRQAVLFDLAERKFYLPGLVLYPQDVFYLAVLLVIGALSLFLFTAVAGRLWCGYACPQTVYTEIFLWIERRIEGDRLARMRLDREPWSARKLALRTAKHGAWLAVAAWTGVTFVGYFTPIGTLLREFATLSLGPWETFWCLFYGFATYGNAGYMREQVCKYMCPYARFQSAMFDRDTLVITYDARRGEPRGPRARSADPAAKGLGDCVDCGICVQVCPTGIDIRHGLQYECIGCAACIDGCDQVMDKMGYPRGLIRYSTENALARGWSGAQVLRRIARPRVLIYAGILAAIVAAMLLSLWARTPLRLDVIRDRATLTRQTVDGKIENVYRLQVMNAVETGRRYGVTVAGLEGLELVARLPVEVPAASTLAVPVTVRADPATVKAGSHVIEFTIADLDDPRVVVTEKTRFHVK
jgi:cytochrome c oxidase accessory protein FixG